MMLTPSKMRYSVQVGGLLVATLSLLLRLDAELTGEILAYCAGYAVVSKGGEVLLARAEKALNPEPKP